METSIIVCLTLARVSLLTIKMTSCREMPRNLSNLISPILTSANRYLLAIVVALLIDHCRKVVEKAMRKQISVSEQISMVKIDNRSLRIFFNG